MKKKKLVDLSIGIRKYILITTRENQRENQKKRESCGEFHVETSTTIMHYSL